MLLFFFILKNILYFRTEQCACKMGVGGGGGGGGVGIVFTIVLFYDHLIEIVS